MDLLWNQVTWVSVERLSLTAANIRLEHGVCDVYIKMPIHFYSKIIRNLMNICRLISIFKAVHPKMKNPVKTYSLSSCETIFSNLLNDSYYEPHSNHSRPCFRKKYDCFVNKLFLSVF